MNYLNMGIIIYIAAINLITFLVFGSDKRKAQRQQWRVPEKTLFLLTFLGGGVGAVVGMKHYHHKTKKWYFKFGIPAILVCEIIAAGYILWKF